MRVAHQLAQDQHVDASCCEVGSERVTEPMRSNTQRPGPYSMGSEDLPEPSLGHRLPCRRATQHHEAL